MTTTTPKIQLAEKYCDFYHDGQKRKGGNEEPYNIHPRGVRDLLVEHGYDDEITQCISLLHDTVEDTDVARKKLRNSFGFEIYNGVYTLSNNTLVRKSEAHLIESLGVSIYHSSKRGRISEEGYKLRLLFARDTIKVVKIGDTIKNTQDLPSLKISSIEKKLLDSSDFYVPLGREIDPVLTSRLEDNILNYRDSNHFEEHFSENTSLIDTIEQYRK